MNLGMDNKMKDGLSTSVVGMAKDENKKRELGHGSARAAKAAFEDQRTNEREYRPSGDVVADDALDEASPSSSGRSLFGMKNGDLLIIGAAVALTIGAAFFAPLAVTAAAVVTTGALVVDAIQHRDDDSSLVDRPGSIVKAVSWGVAAGLAAVGGINVAVVALGVPLVAEVALTDTGLSRLTGQELFPKLQETLKDFWFWIKAALFVVGLYMLRSKRGLSKVGIRTGARVKSSLNRLRQALSRKG